MKTTDLKSVFENMKPVKEMSIDNYVDKRDKFALLSRAKVKKPLISIENNRLIIANKMYQIVNIPLDEIQNVDIENENHYYYIVVYIFNIMIRMKISY